ncbi:hypothetical protein [Halopseudomonas xiamenensis]|nr:hypothetical protein [Halopseudomonas xiamenensis]
MNRKLYCALLLILVTAISTGCSSNKKDYRPLGEPPAMRGN